MANDDAFRTWTDVADRQVEAKLEKLVGSEVQLRFRNGQVAKVPVKGLSKQDQDWIRQWKKRSEDPYDGPPAEEDWPRNVNPSDNASAEVISEDEEKREFIYESENYRFISDIQLSTSLVREFSEVFEVTLLVNSLLPLNLRPIPEPGREKFVARIFENATDYANAGGVPGSAGIYSGADREMKLPITSLGVRTYGDKVTMDYRAEDFGVLIHEITHQSMNRWLARMPLWLVEGSAEYIELAEYDNGRMSFRQQDNRLLNRIETYFGSPFTMVDLETLMALTPQQWAAELQSARGANNYLSALILTYFFYHFDGEGEAEGMKAYLQAAEQMQRGDDVQKLVGTHLLRGRSYDELQEELIRAFRKKGIKIEFP